MLEGHQQVQWVHTASIIVTLMNVNRGKDTSPVKFDQVYPYAHLLKKPKDGAEGDIFDMARLKAEWTA